MSAVVSSVVVIGAWLLLGWATMRAFFRQLPWPMRAGLAFPVGSGLFTWVVFLGSWGGIPLTPKSMTLAYVLLLAGLSVPFLVHPRGGDGPPTSAGISKPSEPWTRWLSGAVWAILALLFMVALCLAVGRAYSQAYDAMGGWALEGYGIAHLGSVFAGASWGKWHLAYPLNIQLQVATMVLIGGEALPGSKLVFPMYLASLALLVFAFWRDQGVPRPLAVLGTLTVASNPVVYLHATNGYANLSFAVELSVGALLCARGIQNDSHQDYWAAGILLAAAAWTRPEGIVMAVIVLIALTVLTRLTTGRWVLKIGQFLPLGLVVATWGVFAWPHLGASQLGQSLEGFVSAIRANPLDLHLFRFLFIPSFFVQRALSPDNWGAFLPGILLILTLTLFGRRAHPSSIQWVIGALGLVLSAVPVFIYYVVSFAPFEDFLLLLRRDFDRAFLPAFIILIVWAINFWGEPMGSNLA